MLITIYRNYARMLHLQYIFHEKQRYFLVCNVNYLYFLCCSYYLRSFMFILALFKISQLFYLESMNDIFLTFISNGILPTGKLLLHIT